MNNNNFKLRSRVSYVGADTPANRADKTVGVLCTGVIISLDFGDNSAIVMPDHRTVLGARMHAVRNKVPFGELNLLPELASA